MTNADRIRSMTDEELRDFWHRYMGGCPKPWEECKFEDSCSECVLSWLKQEVKE